MGTSYGLDRLTQVAEETQTLLRPPVLGNVTGLGEEADMVAGLILYGGNGQVNIKLLPQLRGDFSLTVGFLGGFERFEGARIFLREPVC